MKTVLAKLSRIMGECGYIQKDKKNEFHRYNYASEAAIKEKLHPLLVKHGILFTASVTEMKRQDYQTKKGDRSSLTDVTISYTFYDTESGESFSGTFVGTGDDGADKGTYKAITGAIKYIMTSTFLIPTGDDPEKDSSADLREARKTAKESPDVIPSDSVVSDHDDALSRLRTLFKQLPKAQQNIEFLKTICPVSEFAQLTHCSTEQLEKTIERLSVILSEQEAA